MAPTKIMIIRHGEKPEDGIPDKGIGPDGAEDQASLTAEGWQRAKKLVGFFVDADAPKIATPTKIFACKPGDQSKRPMETVSLLVKALVSEGAMTAADFNTEFVEGDVADLAAAVKASGGVCLICWEHHNIPGIMQQFSQVPASPSKWPGHRFDVVWILDAHPAAWAFSQTPENLLPDDEDKPIKNKDV